MRRTSACATPSPTTTALGDKIAGGGEADFRDEGGKGPSERLVVPGFSGSLDDGSDDLGSSARSYLRQVQAWQRMTRLSPNRQALVLYSHLRGKAWVEAERLDMDKLSAPDGVSYLTQWVRERYLDVQVTQVGRSLSEFFRKLRKKGGQSMRDYIGEFDRAHARLVECGCVLPDLAAAWVFVDRMGLEEASELNLLASVGNVYDLNLLQKAAVIQDRALRKPWEGVGNTKTDKPFRKDWGGKRGVFSANVADFEEAGDDGAPETGAGEEEGEAVPEEVAAELYEAYMTHESAKQKYRDSIRLRGNDAEAMKQAAADRLQAAKAKSFCAGCRRRGHWHKDACCPLNQRGGADTSGNAAQNFGSRNHATSTRKTENGNGGGAGPKSNFPCHVVHVTWDIEDQAESPRLLAITDTACSKSVAGARWLEGYLEGPSELVTNLCSSQPRTPSSLGPRGSSSPITACS